MRTTFEARGYTVWDTKRYGKKNGVRTIGKKYLNSIKI
jgi:hypothetical protein